VLLTIKLYGGLTCHNPNFKNNDSNKFELEMPEGITLREVYKFLILNTLNDPVSIVDGHAQPIDYVLFNDCTISIFLPVSNRH
jgi:hypothetical protein